jgi:site-specific DNA recombinase
MGTYFAYARVSTPRQGEKGVSLQEQKAAIERYAAIHQLEIARWFEERESAAHTGRAAFSDMLRLLHLGKTQGVIIHKIDRSARNMQDWADVGKLADAGVEVHFATENVDLKTVAGRLSADIQAVVAAHYSRNLREEVKKGIYGRLKQGFYPFRAPIGYLDQGAAKAKIADPVRAPLVRQAFELYGSGRFSLPDLVKDLYRMGLRNLNGGPVTMNGLVTILKNSFYVGLIRIEKTGQTFSGTHEPLLTTAAFEKAQAVLAGKRPDRSKSHLFTYSRIARCKTCGYSLIAERQKGHVYYRCHNRPFKNPPICPPTIVREEQLDEAILNALAAVDLSASELDTVRTSLNAWRRDSEKDRAEHVGGIRLQLDRIQSRLEKLADSLIDGTIDKTLFTRKQSALLLEQARMREQLTETEKGSLAAIETLEKIVELAKSPSVLYKTASPEKKRESLKTLLSNLAVSGKNVEVTLAIPFQILAERQKTDGGGPYKGTCRTWEQIVEQLRTHLEKHPLLA